MRPGYRPLSRAFFVPSAGSGYRDRRSSSHPNKPQRARVGRSVCRSVSRRRQLTVVYGRVYSQLSLRVTRASFVGAFGESWPGRFSATAVAVGEHGERINVARRQLASVGSLPRDSQSTAAAVRSSRLGQPPA
jgi:hypothetical protein